MKPNEKSTAELAAAFGREIIDSTITVFQSAYVARCKGVSETALLVQVDILNAGRAVARENSDADFLSKVMCKAHRQAVKSAGAAVDAGVPLVVALLVIRGEMEDRLEANQRRKRKENMKRITRKTMLTPAEAKEYRKMWRADEKGHRMPLTVNEVLRELRVQKGLHASERRQCTSAITRDTCTNAIEALQFAIRAVGRIKRERQP